jgi:hypothetical protein
MPIRKPSPRKYPALPFLGLDKSLQSAGIPPKISLPLRFMKPLRDRKALEVMKPYFLQEEEWDFWFRVFSCRKNEKDLKEWNIMGAPKVVFEPTSPFSAPPQKSSYIDYEYLDSGR